MGVLLRGLLVGLLALGSVRRDGPERDQTAVPSGLRLSGLDLNFVVGVFEDDASGRLGGVAGSGGANLPADTCPVGLDAVRVDVDVNELLRDRTSVVLRLRRGVLGVGLERDVLDDVGEGVGRGRVAAALGSLDGHSVGEGDLGVAHQNSVSFCVGVCFRRLVRLTLIVA